MSKRNPMAALVRQPQYAKRVVKNKKAYTRKTKHKGGF